MARTSVEPNEEKMLANISAIADYLKYQGRKSKISSDVKLWKKELDAVRQEHLKKFSLEELKKIPKNELEISLYANRDENPNSLKYILAENNAYYKFGGCGQANKPPKSAIEFIEYLENVDKFINDRKPESLVDYKELWQIKNHEVFFRYNWIAKHLYILYPDIFVSQLSDDKRQEILNIFSIRPQPKTQDYANVFQLSQLSKSTEIPSYYFEELIKILPTYKEDTSKEETNREIVQKEVEKLYKTNYTKPEKYSFNCIFFGAPGTGKSHELEDQRKELLEEELLGEKEVRNQYERVTFHPDYSYANFVGTYKPVPVEQNGEETISYRYVPGPFMRILVKALINSAKSKLEDVKAKPYLLIIEEINRANVAAVFGDVFQLLDRKEGMSEYEIHLSEDMKNYIQKSFDEAGIQLKDSDTIKLPNNLFIWATMNSADQGVFPMDTAFKRRWDFEYIGINDGEAGKDGKDGILDYTFTLGEGNSERKVNWNQLRKAINNCLSEEGINEDKLMGPYFISLEKLRGGDEVFINAFKNKVLMYLFDDAAKHKRSKVFSEEINSNIYSKICEEFDKKGVFVFADKISAQFKEPRDPQPASEQSQEDNS